MLVVRWFLILLRGLRMLLILILILISVLVSLLSSLLWLRGALRRLVLLPMALDFVSGELLFNGVNLMVGLGLFTRNV